MSARDPARIQRALVCMLHDPAYARRILAGGDVERSEHGEPRGRGRDDASGDRERDEDRELDRLNPDELELLRALDPRVLVVDPLRRARGVQALLEEYPVSGALLGVAAVDRFFSARAFRRCVFAGPAGSMALSFGTWLEDQAGGAGRLEAAIARARRRPPRAPQGDALIACAPGVVAVVVPAGTLAWTQRARERLGADPLRAIAALRKPWPQRPPRAGEEGVIAQAGGDGQVSLGTASLALTRLLLAADAPRRRADLEGRAVELGCDREDAPGLIDDLRGEGLLVP